MAGNAGRTVLLFRNKIPLRREVSFRHINWTRIEVRMTLEFTLQKENFNERLKGKYLKIHEAMHSQSPQRKGGRRGKK